MTDARRISVRELPSAVVSITGQREAYFPVVVSPAEGRAVAVQRGGAGHVGIGRLDVVASEDFGRTWSPPGVVVDSERDDRNPSVGVLSDGSLLVAYHWQGSYTPEGKWDPSIKRASTRLVRSDAARASWGRPYAISCQGLDGCSPYGRIVRGPENELIMPIYGRPRTRIPGVEMSGDESCSFIVRSRDEGLSWEDVSLVGEGVNETEFLLLGDGRMLAVMRTEGDARLLAAVSGDAGRSWSEFWPVTGPGEHPGSLLGLSNGWILLCYGRRHPLPEHPEDEPRYGVEGVVLRDDGRSWSDARLVFGEDHPIWDFGYPSSVHVGGGRIVTCYYANEWPTRTKEWTEESIYDGSNARCYAVSYEEEELLSALEEAFAGIGP